jgi:hypothetical protein
MQAPSRRILISVFRSSSQVVVVVVVAVGSKDAPDWWSLEEKPP